MGLIPEENFSLKDSSWSEKDSQLGDLLTKKGDKVLTLRLTEQGPRHLEVIEPSERVEGEFQGRFWDEGIRSATDAMTGSETDRNVVSNLWNSLEGSSSTSPKYRWMFRWTEHSKNDKTLFGSPEKVLELIRSLLSLKKLVFQIERGEQTKKLHYQGVFALTDDQKKRQETLERLLRPHFFGIDIRPCHDLESAIKYCSKIDTRKGGPYSFP